MWYEIIPPFMIITFAMATPPFTSYLMGKLLLGNNFRRALYDHDERIQYLRDTRLTGNPYVLQGLEAIPEGPIVDISTGKSGKSGKSGENGQVCEVPVGSNKLDEEKNETPKQAMKGRINEEGECVCEPTYFIEKEV